VGVEIVRLLQPFGVEAAVCDHGPGAPRWRETAST
jgi:hypothetical protein